MCEVNCLNQDFQDYRRFLVEKGVWVKSGAVENSEETPKQKPYRTGDQKMGKNGELNSPIYPQNTLLFRAECGIIPITNS